MVIKLPATRDVFRWKKKVFWHKTANNFLDLKELKSGLHTFSHFGLFYDLLIENNKSDIVVFYFHASIEREDKKLPFFMGNRVLSNEKVNRVFISDPSLYMSSDLSLAWYAGVFNGEKVQNVLLRLIRFIIDIFQSKKVVFFGPSNGGFAALWFSWHFPGSLAYVMNPQTRIGDFTLKAVEKFSRECLGIKEINNPHEDIINFTGADVRDLYKYKIENNVIYLQNESDHHVVTQLLPFLNGLESKNKIEVIYGNWGIGHKAPPVDFINKDLKARIFCGSI